MEIPTKQSFTPETPQNYAELLGDFKALNQGLWKFHMVFFISPGNSTVFVINPWKFHLLILEYSWKFHILTPPLSPPSTVCLFFLK